MRAYDELTLRDGYSPRYVWGHGPTPCPIMVVGEAPGQNEDEQGVPFVGKAGSLLRQTLADAGLTDEVFITNVVKQRPPKNRTPTKEEIDTQFPYLVGEIVHCNPRYLLLLGNTALAALTDKRGVMTHRGQIAKKATVFPEKDPIQIIYVTLHPSAALRSKAHREVFEKDIQVFVGLTQSEYTPSIRGEG